ncbi:MAG: hypothetical protein ABEJ23_08340 [Haloarculaceae archaeon]
MSRGGGRWRQSSLFTSDSALMYVVIGLVGLLDGLLAGAVGYFVDLTFLHLHAAVWLFLISWAATTAYLSYERVPSGVLAVGLYFAGLFVLLQPVVIYGPSLVAATRSSGVNSARHLVASWQGILVWGVIAGGLALAIGIVSRLLRRHADSVVRSRYKLDRWNGQDD